LFNCKSNIKVLACVLACYSAFATAASSDMVVYESYGDFPEYGIHVKDKKGSLSKAASPESAESSIGIFKADPKGKLVLFAADQDADGAPLIYRTDVKSGTATSVGGLFAEGTEIGNINIDSKGKYALLLVDGSATELRLLDFKTNEVTTVTEIAKPEWGYSSIFYADFNSAGTGIIYQKWVYDFDSDNLVDELWYYDISAAENIRVAAVTNNDGHIEKAVFVNGGRGILYSSNLNGDDTLELNLYDIASGETELRLESSDDIYIDDVDAKGANVLLAMAPEMNDYSEYHYSIKKDTITTLTQPGQSAYLGVIDPKGKTAVVRVSVDSGSALVAFDLKKGTTRQLSPVLEGEQYFSAFDFDVKGKALLYIANQDNINSNELFHVVVKAGQPTKVNDDIIGSINSCYVNRTGKAVYYTAYKTELYQQEIYKKDLKTGNTTKVSHTLPEAGNVGDFQVVGGKGIHLAFPN